MGFENKDVLGNTIEAQAKETIEKVINQVKARNIGESEFPNNRRSTTFIRTCIS